MMEESVKEFIDKVASSSPTPGGGSIAALAGAMAGSLAEMVCNLTIGKKKYADVEEDMKILRKKCEGIRKRFMELVDEDAAAFDKVMEAFKKKEGIQNALKLAAEVPLDTARESISLLNLLKEIAEKGNKNSISDAGVAALMAQASFNSAILNVRINLKEMEDMDYRKRKENEMAEMKDEMENGFDEVMEIVERWL